MQSSKTKWTSYLAVALVFGLFGTIALTISHAGTPTNLKEAEAGTASGCTGTATDSSAAGGKAVVFGGCGNAPLSLDASGATVPDTAYLAGSCDVTVSSSCANTIFMSPSGSDGNAGTKAAPVKTINQAVSLVPEGGYIVMRAGTYRDWYHNGASTGYGITAKGFTLQAYPHEQVWFDGTDVEPASNWTSDGAGHWYMAWNTPQFCNGHYYDFPYNSQAKSPSNLTGVSGTTYTDNQGPCTHWDQYGSSEANYPAAGDPQMVFIDGVREPEVDTLAGATGGSFFYDWANKRMYISTNPSGHTVELAARPNGLVLGNSTVGYTVRGIGFKRYASNEYSNVTDAALYVGGNNPVTIENDTFTQNAGIGLSLNTAESVINSSVFAFNGFNGAGYYGHDHTTGATDNLLLENSVFNNNNLEHYGLNCSISCAAAGIKMGAVLGYTIKNNIFENNLDGSTGAWCDTDCFNGTFVNNVSKNNSVGYHYEQDDGGIIASNLFMNNKYGVDVGATNTKVYNNTFVNNSTINIRVYDDNRPLITSGISIGNNVVAGTSVNDDYFGSGSDTSVQSEPSTWFTTFDYNSYWRPSNFVLYRMIGAADQHWNSSSSYSAAFSGLEAHATDYVGSTDPFFVDSGTGNYTIRTDSAAYDSGGAIPADVASALGVSQAAGQTRGGFAWPGK